MQYRNQPANQPLFFPPCSPRNGLRTAPSQSNMANATRTHRATAASSSSSLLPPLTGGVKAPDAPSKSSATHNLAATGERGKGGAGGTASKADPHSSTTAERSSQQTKGSSADGGGTHPSAPETATPTTTTTKTTAVPSSLGGKRKPNLRRGGPGSSRGASGKGGGRGGRHGAGKGGGAAEESPEQHAARNLDIFEKHLADLGLPKGATGKGAGEDRCGWFLRVILKRASGGRLAGCEIAEHVPTVCCQTRLIVDRAFPEGLNREAGRAANQSNLPRIMRADLFIFLP